MAITYTNAKGNYISNSIDPIRTTFTADFPASHTPLYIHSEICYYKSINQYEVTL